MRKKFLFVLICSVAAITACNKDNQEYTITVPIIDNGTVTITVDGKAVTTGVKAEEGATVILTATPGVDYKFGKWTTTDITLNDPVAETVTFTMPAKDVSITAVFLYFSQTDPGVEINGVIWATRSLDAPGSFAKTPYDYGMHYQWNRKTGWYDDENGVLSSVPEGKTWDSTTPTGLLWDAENDPSPEGWRIPTHAEFTKLFSSTVSREYIYETDNTPSGYRFTDNNNGNSIFFATAGVRIVQHSDVPDGTLINHGVIGHYWSCEQYDDYDFGAYHLFFHAAHVTPHSGSYKVYGFSVRPVAK